VNNILLSGRTLLALINDILDLSKIESGKFELSKEPVNVTNLLKEFEQIFSFQTNSKKIDFHTLINFDPNYYFIIDEIRLRQVLFNLVGNAVKFTDKGNVTIEADFIFNKDSTNFGTLTIKVKDTGIGISKEHFDLIFESFRQVTIGESKKYGGTGLGLAISKRLVNLMGGEINVESEINLGSIFTVTLYNIEISKISTSNLPNSGLNIAQIKFANSDILIIDDNDYSREITKIMLTELGLTVFQAKSLQEAIHVLNEITPSVILLEFRMSNINGFEVAKKISSLPNAKGSKILAFTASSKSDNEILELFNFDDIIRKPIIKDKLIDTLKTFIPFATQIDLVDDINLHANNNNLVFNDKILSYFENIILPKINVLKEIVILDDLESLIKNFEQLWQDCNNLIFYDEIKKLQTAKENFDFEQIEKIINLINEKYLIFKSK